MKRITHALLIAIIFPVLCQGQVKTYDPEAVISILGGVQYNVNSKAADPVYGIEFSMECPLGQNSKSRIRQQFSLVLKESKDDKSITVEMNPQYKLVSTSSFEVGVGPSVGLIFSKISADNRSVFCYGIGASTVYHFKKFFIGFETRYAFTERISYMSFPGDPESMITGRLNNWSAVFKVGHKLGK